MVKTGKKGAIKLGETATAVAALDMNTWSASIEHDVIDYTKYEGGGWKNKVGNTRDWSGSGGGNLNASDTTGQKALIMAAANGTLVNLELFTDTDDATAALAGPVFITNVDFETPVDDLITFSFEFSGDGAPTGALVTA